MNVDDGFVTMTYWNYKGEHSHGKGVVDETGDRVEWNTESADGSSATAFWMFDGDDYLEWESEFHDTSGDTIRKFVGTNARVTVR